MKKNYITIGIFALLLSQTCSANDLVYQFQNSAFGGSPAATQVLLSKANAQNETQRTRKSAVERFQEQLERSVLRAISRRITDSFDEDAENLTGKVLGSEDFSITILTDNDESIVLQINNFENGDVTTMTIPKI